MYLMENANIATILMVFWFLSKIRDLSSIRGRFQLEFRDKYSRVWELKKHAYVKIQGDFIYLKKFLTMRLGNFRLGNDEQPVYVYLVSNIFLTDLSVGKLMKFVVEFSKK